MTAGARILIISGFAPLVHLVKAPRASSNIYLHMFVVYAPGVWYRSTPVDRVTWDSNLVDSASSIRLSQRLSHACLSINESILWNCEWLIISVIVYLMVLATWITVVILELIHASNPDSRRGVFIRWKPMRGHPRILVIHNNFRIDLRIDASFKFLPYQLWMVGYWPTMALTGNGELGFDSGEGAWETATTSKEGSRRANYPILTQGGSDKK